MKKIHLLLVSVLFIGCSKTDVSVPKDEPIKPGGAYVLLSLKLDNTNDTLVISNSYTPKVVAEYSNGMVVDFSDSVQITTLDNTVVLNNKKYYGVKSGIAKFEIKYKEYSFKDTINVTNVEYVPVPAELKSKNRGVLRVPVVIINYLPTKDGIELDRNRTQDSVGQDMSGAFYTLDRAQSKTLKDKIIEKNAIEEGTNYHDYATNKTTKYIDIDVVAYINVYEMNYNYIGISSNYKRPWWNLDYNELMSRIDLKKYVEELGVKEVWLTTFPREQGYLSYNVDESNMSSPVTGDISNSYRLQNDLPIYNKTYVMYGDNGWRGVPEDLHNRGHQIESQLSHIDGNLWWGKFAKTGRCGWTHMPINTLKHYDYAKDSVVSSDILTWKPSGGTFVNLNRDSWINKKYQFESQIAGGMVSNSAGLSGTVDYANDAHVKWLIFWWQSIPGYNNNIVDGTTTVNNWWDLFYNWDDTMRNRKKLLN
jgi:hypothetical protein